MESTWRRAILTGCFGLAVTVPLLAGCDNNSKELAQLREEQQKILAKLDALEKKVAAAPPPAQPARRAGPDPTKQFTIPVDQSPSKGPESAPITIIEFSDYQCPFCSRAEPLVGQVLQEYGDKARVVFKHFPLTSIHPNALPAARAAAAAQRQGKFWEMHETLFKNQRALNPDQLKQYAAQIGLDVAKFEADMNSEEVKAQVQKDMQLAQQIGVRGTPTMFVNGKIVQNRSLQGFKGMIDPILAAGG